MNIMKKDTKIVVIKDFTTSALTSWGKPYTGSEDCVIPKGTVMVTLSDQLPNARGFGVRPEKYKELEKKFIPEKTLNDKDYGGYYFVFLSDDLGKYFEMV